MSKKIVFLHLPKTGGTFLSQYEDKSFVYAGHMTASYLNNNWLMKKKINRENAYVIGFVRNPWDWYVSRYSYFRDCRNIERGLSKYNDAGLNNKDFRRKFPTFKEHILWGVENNLNRFWLSDMYKYMYYENEILLLDEVLKFEGFVENLDRIYNNLKITPNKDIRHHKGNKNKSKRAHYSKYYDDELICIVKNKDKTIIEKYNYEFQTK